MEMAWLRPGWIVGGLVALTALGVGGSLWIRGSSASQVRPTDLYRTYTATGQVTHLKALGARGCRVQVRLHQWVSLSDGFSLAEIPQKGQLYTLDANLEQCLALEVALASVGDSEDPKSPHHIYYKAGQRRSGEWHMTENPSAPVGCGGL